MKFAFLSYSAVVALVVALLVGYQATVMAQNQPKVSTQSKNPTNTGNPSGAMPSNTTLPANVPQAKENKTDGKMDNMSKEKTAAIDDFAKLFASETKPMPFAVGKVWLQKKPKAEALTESLAKRYILNNKIWVNNLKKETIPTSENFYPVAQVVLSANFYSFLVANSQNDVTDVYLLNYSKEGKFIDGVCAISIRPSTESYFRNTILTDGRMIMVKESKQGSSQLFTFDLWDIGNFHGRL
jgi:hypothetical protein